jgi:hypothetical protein
MELREAKARAYLDKWRYVRRLCQDTVRATERHDAKTIRQKLRLIAKHLEEAERLERARGVVQGEVVDAHVIQGRVLKELP